MNEWDIGDDNMEPYEQDGYMDGVEYGMATVLDELRKRVDAMKRSRSSVQQMDKANSTQFSRDLADRTAYMVAWGEETLEILTLEFDMRWVPKMDGGYYERVRYEEEG
jgi:hypothetical protein